MTNEEYVKWLKQLDENLKFDGLIDGDKEVDLHEMIFDLCEMLEQQTCKDAVSREAVLMELDKYLCGVPFDEKGIDEVIKELPSVNPQPKTGHWIDIMVGDMPAQACDQCNTFYPLAYTGGGHKYCPNCGCRMVEQQESEVEE